MNSPEPKHINLITKLLFTRSLQEQCFYFFATELQLLKKCLFLLLPRENILPQFLHEYAFSLRWTVRWCINLALGPANNFPQTSHVTLSMGILLLLAEGKRDDLEPGQCHLITRIVHLVANIIVNWVVYIARYFVAMATVIVGIRLGAVAKNVGEYHFPWLNLFLSTILAFYDINF